MPTFDDHADTSAPPEEVWKVLYDPSRFPEWWAGLERVVEGDMKGGDAPITVYPDGYPDFPMPQQLETRHEERRVTVSCTTSDLVFDWRRDERAGADGTRITVHVELPEREAARLQAQRELVGASLRNLAALTADGA
jgi:uncharacterized protein YndB with AHSA1/START domain